MMDEKAFINAYNDFSIIGQNVLLTGQDELFHYTSSVAALNGILSGEFFASDILCFADGKEGNLIFDRIKHFLACEGGYNEILRTMIATKEKVEEFLKLKNTYVLSLCLNGDSTHMRERYGHYTIVIDHKIFFDSLHIRTGNGEIRNGNIFKRARIVYSKNEHERIIKSELQKLSGYEIQNDLLDLILRKLMYLGNFFKDEEPYAKEQEYRVLLNAAEYGSHAPAYLPKRESLDENKFITRFYFDKKAIRRIVISSREAEIALIENRLKIPVVVNRWID